MAVVLDNSVYQLPDRSWVDRRYQQYGKTYFQMADIRDKIAEEMGKLKLPESWKEGNEIQNGFHEMLTHASDDFSHGMTDRNVAALLDARNYYASKIVPIKEAVNRYNTIQDMITKAGGDAIVGNNSQLSIEEIYKNGAVHAPLRTISRQQTVNGASQYFRGIENLLANDYTFKKYLDDADGYLKATKEGFSNDELLTMALSNYVSDSHSPESDAVRKYLDSYINGLGVGDFDEEGMSKVRGAALDGMVRAFQQDRSKLVSDQSQPRRLARERMDLSRQNSADSNALAWYKATHPRTSASSGPKKLNKDEIALADGTVVRYEYRENDKGDKVLTVRNPYSGEAYDQNTPEYEEAAKKGNLAKTIKKKSNSNGSSSSTGSTGKRNKDAGNYVSGNNAGKGDKDLGKKQEETQTSTGTPPVKTRTTKEQ